MKLSVILKKKTAKKESVVVKVDKNLLKKIVGGTESINLTATFPTEEPQVANSIKAGQHAVSNFK